MGKIYLNIYCTQTLIHTPLKVHKLCPNPELSTFRLSAERRTVLLSLPARPVPVSSESTDTHSMSLSPHPWELRSMSPSSFSEPRLSPILTSELRAEVVVTLAKSTPSDRLSPKPSSPIIKNTSTKTQRENLKRSSSNTIEPFWSLTPEDASPRNTVVVVPDQETKNLTDEHGKALFACYLNTSKQRKKSREYLGGLNEGLELFGSLVVCIWMEKENKEWRKHLEGNDWTVSREIIKREKNLSGCASFSFVCMITVRKEIVLWSCCWTNSKKMSKKGKLNKLCM